MSRENVEAFKRAIEAANRPGHRGHEGVRKVFQDLYDVFAEVQVLISEIRDLGDRVVVTGVLRGLGTESWADVTTPWGAVVEFKDGKGIRVSDYLDPSEPPLSGVTGSPASRPSTGRSIGQQWAARGWRGVAAGR